jgi:hypothetical protein
LAEPLRKLWLHAFEKRWKMRKKVCRCCGRELQQACQENSNICVECGDGLNVPVIAGKRVDRDLHNRGQQNPRTSDGQSLNWN